MNYGKISNNVPMKYAGKINNTNAASLFIVLL